MELIDTLWNVNQLIQAVTGSQFRELIDTLWNVNESGRLAAYLGIGINRYIMECKLQLYNGKKRSKSELIDTLWNVNLVRLHILEQLFPN